MGKSVTPKSTSQQEHNKYCVQPKGHPDEIDLRMKVHVPDVGMVPLCAFNRAGDVRRCVHGVIMIGYQKYLNVNEVHWRDVTVLSPTWFKVRKLV